MPSYLITGANRGLGYGFVQFLAKDPANTVIGVARDKAAADNKVAAEGFKNVTMLKADIVDREALLAARDQVVKITGGHLDYLINNAAYIAWSSLGRSLGDFEDNPDLLESELIESFKVNVIGVINTINIFLPLLKKSSIKKVVLISSAMADPDLVNNGVSEAGPYAISKAGANMAIYKYNAEYQKEGILFFALSPGVVKTWEDAAEPPNIGTLRAMMPADWSGPVTPVQSAGACIKVLHDFEVEKGSGGAFVSHLGIKKWL